MRITVVSPLIESVPPKTYGGTERIVSYLTEELVGQGHDVTLFASGDSRTKARLYPTVDEALRLSKTPRNAHIQHMIQLEHVARMREEFDIIHFHTDYCHFPIFRQLDTPHLTTLHGRLDLPDLADVYNEFSEMPVVSISNSQRRPLPQANWFETIYNGTPDHYTFNSTPGSYFAFLGRFSPEKGPEQAIEIAIRTGVPLKMAAKIDPVDAEFFESRIKPFLDHPLIEYIGEVDEQGKNELLTNAIALLFPIQWPEPFGVVMTESMACGTPVIAFENGSVPEIMKHGISGFVVHNVDEAIAAAEQIESIDRRGCREYFESRFTTHHMAKNYVAAYERLLMSRPGHYRKRIISPTVSPREKSSGLVHVSPDAAVR